MKTVFVALSGGVDSSVAAALLKESGLHVVGIHIVCWDGCEQGDERRDALRVALDLGIPFLTFDLREAYKKRVFDYMVREYAAGQTPNPDVMCNREIKFGLAMERAIALGADYFATGHYARLRLDGGQPQLHEGSDNEKDQSYFLWPVQSTVLRRCLFPLGDYTKARVRALASRMKLSTAEKKDSQGLCFIGKVDFGYFLRGLLPPREGVVVTSAGTVVGKHDGAWFYTIGQRRGLGIGGGIPYYIAEKNTRTNTLVVGIGPEDPILYKQEIFVQDLNWLADFDEGACEVRIRYRQSKIPAFMTKENERVQVHFGVPQRGVAPGQSAVFYQGTKLLGGGIIV